ncbi:MULTISPECIES: ATP-grasp domain-containing protein [unclassified Streptomyces]|uniref:preATP grasp domain-containing protein n=1 Tax=unclassified Streptomyces TaxID=2593676 RepID=UPI000475E39D|nr:MULTISPECIES: ATP-grasp domain-containing protein [unclassified Streptomyces]MYT31696.1 ATP-grasp domain-containing protein [Streptomyces sp. SID8354]
MSSYLRMMKKAVTGDPDTVFVFLCNFEVERDWAENYIGLPGPQVSGTDETVQRMEELGALLGAESDFLLVQNPLDSSFRDYAAALGLTPPTELVPEKRPEGAGTAAAVLSSPQLLARLRELGEGGAYLIPMGTSPEVQKIAEETGLRLAGAGADIAEKVNSKIYSRRVTEELGLRSIAGRCCENIGELADALDWGLADSPAVIVKEAYGVSGRGLIVIDSPKKADRLLRMVRRRAAQSGSDRIDVVVERFLAKKADLNYQFVIGRDGSVHFDFVKQALTENGVHKGHLMPAGLTPQHSAEIEQAAHTIGARLFADGFFGVVGVDAILGADDLIYPVLEINARLNMSSYQGSVIELLAPSGSAVLAKHYPLRLDRPLAFEDIRTALGPYDGLDEDATGLVINCFGTVNAQAHVSPAGFDGRLYTLLFAPDKERLLQLDTAATERLACLSTKEGASR